MIGHETYYGKNTVCSSTSVRWIYIMSTFAFLEKNGHDLDLTISSDNKIMSGSFNEAP